MAKHLTDAEITDYFLGEPLARESAEHLAVCQLCTREISLTSEGVGSLNELGANWAALEAPRRIPVPSRPRFGAFPGKGLAWGLAAMTLGALVAVGLPSLTSRHLAASLAGGDAPSAAQVQRDNQWLAAMDRDLRYGPDSINVASDVLQPATLHAKRHNVRVVSD